MVDKIDSNSTALAFAEEQRLGVLPGTPIWKSLEPNSYNDFGAQTKLMTRRPINPTRQRSRGVVVDVDASGAFNQDLTFENTFELLQGFLFADAREKPTTIPMLSGSFPLDAAIATTDNYTGTGIGTLGFLDGSIIFGFGFEKQVNNGMHVVSAVATDSITVSESLADETPSADAGIKVVGYQFDSATLNVVITNNLPVLTRASGTVDYTTLGLIAGEWIFLGGDNTTHRFANNQGWARIKSITVSSITLDKTSFEPTAETGTGKTIQIFFGDIIRNEPATADIVRRTYQLERQMGEDDNGVMSEYLIGCVCNELTINVPQADKVTLDFGFTGIDSEARTGTTGIKSGTRVAAADGDAYNTSSDFSRIKLAIVDTADAAPAPLFAFATELSITIKNNATPNKAIGVLGSFEVSVGAFEVGGSLNVYFAGMEAVQAVKDNTDTTIDIVLVKNNSGLLFDLPMVELSDGRLSVQLDQAVMLPLESSAVKHPTLGYTLLTQRFSYLPDLAA